MTSASNSICFRAEGSNNNKADVDIKITEDNGSLIFELNIVNPQNNSSALHSLYFDLNAFSLGEASTFEITGEHIVDPLIEADAVSSKTTGDGNGNGHFTKEFFDVGIAFPSIGNGQSQLFSTTFTLADTSGRPLTLGLVGGQSFGIRLASPDDKIETVSAQAPTNNPPTLQVVTLTDGTEDEIYTVRAADLIEEAWDSDGDPLTVTAVTVKSGGGSVTQTADGVWTYTPAPDSHGPVVLQYSVFDGKTTATSVANLNLKEVNDRPTISPVTVLGEEDRPISGRVTGSDVDGDILTYRLASDGSPRNGTVIVNDDGSFSYRGGEGFTGTDSFTVLVSDGRGGEATALVTVDVQPVNGAPIAATQGNFASGDEDQLLSGTIPAGYDPDGDPVSYELVSSVTGLTLGSDGNFTYQPAENANGSVTFQYRVVDSSGAKSDPQTYTLEITPVNDAPDAAPVRLPDSKAGQPVTITAQQLLAQASDVDGDELIVTSLSLKTGGGTLVSNLDGTWTYTPDAQHTGPVTFDYVVSDGEKTASSTATLPIVPASTTAPGNGGSDPAGTFDDLIYAGDGDDIIHGGRGNDVMHGGAGDDVIIGGSDNGSLEWEGATLKTVIVGDNLYGDDGKDTYFFEQGSGVDMVWDFRPDADTMVLDYNYKDIIGATYVTGVTNSIGTPTHGKIALILSQGDAIIINDFGGLRDSDREAFVFADGTRLSMRQLVDRAEKILFPTDLLPTWTKAPGVEGSATGRSVDSLDLTGNNGADTLLGRAGDDHLSGNEGENQLNGNDGNDELRGGNVSDILIGGNGNDIGYGQSGDDIIVGGVGSDRLHGDGGRDIIYGDTDGDLDGSDFSLEEFEFKFGLGLESTYEDLFKSADPVNGITVRPGDLAITKGNNWWGGFQVTLTVKAEASLGNWSLFLNSAYEITSIWGAEISKLTDGKTSDVYELKNASWNGSLTKGQTTTIGFTVRTPFDRLVESETELLKGLKIGTTATLDQGVASAISDINKYLDGLKSVTTSESYTLTGNAQKLAAASGRKSIDLTGNKLGNTIVGNDGANEIAGRAGKDVLTGKKGKDAFVFDTVLSKSNVDTITDFSVKDDVFQLDNAIFKKLGSGTPSKPKQLNKNFFSLDKAKDKNDYLIYSKKTGVLSYDADGSGKGQAVEFTKIKAGLELKFSHFYII